MIGNLRIIRSEGFRALTRELGVAGTVVFMRQFEAGSGNFTEERIAMLTANSVDDIAVRIRKRNSEQSQEQG